MKIISHVTLVSKGNFKNSDEYKTILSELRTAINSVSWGDQNEFIIFPEKKGNGVSPIKINFMMSLRLDGWKPEQKIGLLRGKRPGKVDVLKRLDGGLIVAEWETGNISSSHRALNKIAVGIIQKTVLAGFLIVPHKELSQYLTDRIGNFEELVPYFPLYSHLEFEEGLIEIFGISYDKVSDKVVRIPKGKDGNAIKEN